MCNSIYWRHACSRLTLLRVGTLSREMCYLQEELSLAKSNNAEKQKACLLLYKSVCVYMCACSYATFICCVYSSTVSSSLFTCFVYCSLYKWCTREWKNADKWSTLGNVSVAPWRQKLTKRNDVGKHSIEQLSVYIHTHVRIYLHLGLVSTIKSLTSCASKL